MRGMPPARRSASVQPDKAGAMKYDRALLRDVAVIGLDALVGTAIGLALFASPANFWIVLLGAAMAILPAAIPLRGVSRARHCASCSAFTSGPIPRCD
jgi:hypothetical protein